MATPIFLVNRTQLPSESVVYSVGSGGTHHELLTITLAEEQGRLATFLVSHPIEHGSEAPRSVPHARLWPLVVALKHVQALQANVRLQAAGCARAENLARLVTRGFDEREQTIDVLERAWLLEDIRREESGE